MKLDDVDKIDFLLPVSRELDSVHGSKLCEKGDKGRMVPLGRAASVGDKIWDGVVGEAALPTLMMIYILW